MTPSQDDQTDWREIRRRYENEVVVLTQLATAHCLSYQKIVAHAHAHNWQRYMDPSLKKKPASLHRQVPGKKKPGLIPARLRAILEQQIAGIEQKMKTPHETSTAERERNARTLSSLIRTFEKLKKIESGTGTSGGPGEEESPRSIKALRDTLQRRLSRLADTRTDRPVSQDIEPA